MYKYLRGLMNVADLVGNVENVVFMEWGVGKDRVQLDGKQEDGKKFCLILECEVDKDGT